MSLLRRLAALSCLPALALASPVQAGKADDTLRIVWRTSIPNIDPHHNNLREGVVVAKLVWDTLIDKDTATGAFMPLLATSWRWVDDKTLDMDLRQGVTFHNGDSFSADDVVYTLNYIADPNSKISNPNGGSWIDKAEKTGDYSVRIHCKNPFPAALEYLAGPIAIYPAAYHKKMGPEGMGQRPVGSGPYKITEINGVNRYLMERNESYFGGGHKGRAKIGRIELRVVNDPATELAEMISGKADWVWKFNADQIAKLNTLPNVRATLDESMRIGFIGINIVAQPNSPLSNVKVRQAMNYAINKDSLVKNLVQGKARAIDAACYPEQFGCIQSAAVKYAYDPDKAKALLAEAGFPNGFSTTLVGFRSAQWTAAVQNDLAKVGIQAKTSIVQGATLVDMFKAGDTQLAYWDWGSYSINDVSAVLPPYFADDGYDRSQDKEVADLIRKGGAVVDEGQRKEFYGQAIRLITERAYAIPLHTFVIPYAYNKDLDFRPYPDETPRFYEYGWK